MSNTTNMPLEDLFGLLSEMIKVKQDQFIHIVDNPQHTKNLFGPIEEIAGKRLKLIEKNKWGDCLCMFEGKSGPNLVDIDNRDVVK